ncbi:MAG: MerR family transcriptional regulator [Planctomycetota bacterium]
MNTTLALPMHRQKAFTSAEVVRTTGVSMMQINHWDRLGIAKPSLRPAGGTGSRRLYSPDDLATVEVAHRLRALNISLECLGPAIRDLRLLWPNLAAVAAEAVVLVCPKGRCIPVTRGGDLTALLSEERVGILLDLGGLIRDLRAKLSLTSGLGPPPPTPAAAPAEKRSQASAWGEGW